MRKLAILIPLAALVLTACSDTSRLNRKEDRLIGAWEFEKAFYKGDNALFRDNITDEFEGDIIEFFPDYGAVYDDLSAGIVFDGDWELILERSNFNGDEEVEFYLDMFFYDNFGRLSMEYLTTVNRLSNERIEMTAYNARGRYTFKLRKL